MALEGLHKGGRNSLCLTVNYFHDKEKEKLRSYDNVTIYDVPELHARCYTNGSGVVLTSLSL